MQVSNRRIRDDGSSDDGYAPLFGLSAPADVGAPPASAAQANTAQAGPGLSITASNDSNWFFVPGSGTGDAAGSVLSGPATSTLYWAPVVKGANDVSAPQASIIARAGDLYNLGSMFTVSPVNGVMPATITVGFYDRDNYAGNQTYAYGTLYGTDGEKDSSSSYTLTFTLKNGQYVDGAGMKLSDYTFQASSQANRMQDITLSAYSANGTALGTRDVTITTNATANYSAAGVSIASVIADDAKAMIGQTWNNNGCWVLASDIAACAGVSLTENSGFIAPTMQEANGAVTVAYDAASGVKSNWASTLQVGDIVEVGWLSQFGGGGHIFTIDQITNGNVYLVDNSGAKPSGDKVSTDVTVAQQNLATYLPYIDPTSVVVFRATGTETAAVQPPPTVLVNSFTDVAAGGTVAASSLFSAMDASGKAITQYMVRDDGTSGHFNLSGKAQADGQWITVSAAQLAQLTYTAGTTSSTSDTIEVKASDGTYGTADIGRVVSLSSLSGQTSGGVGTVVSGQSKTETDYVASAAESWTFTVGASSGAVGISIADVAGSVNLSVTNAAGQLLASYNEAAFSNPLTLYGTLSAGTYTVKVTDLSGATNYDLSIGSQNTVLAQAAAETNGYTPPTSSTGASAPSVTGTYTASALLSGSAPSLAFADSAGVGTSAASTASLVSSLNQSSTFQLATQT